jgi:hypothetical protein
MRLLLLLAKEEIISSTNYEVDVRKVGSFFFVRRLIATTLFYHRLLVNTENFYPHSPSFHQSSERRTN